MISSGRFPTGLSTETACRLRRQGWSVPRIANRYKVTRQAVYRHLDKAKRRRHKKAGARKRRRKNYNGLINWRIYNEGLVRRGEILLDLDWLNGWRQELRRMNKGKAGRPYRYPDSHLLFLLQLKCMFKIDYRTLDGMGRRLVRLLAGRRSSPDYTTLQRRLRSLNVRLEVFEQQPGQEIAGDSTGLKTSNRGEYRMNMYHEGTKKKYVKLHMAVNIRNRQLVYCDLTDDRVSDSTKLSDMIGGAGEFGKVGRALFDKGYDGKENHWKLLMEGIEDGIKPRESLGPAKLDKRISEAEVRLEKKPDSRTIRQEILRWEKLREYYRNPKRWAKKHDYGQRWKIEGRYSVFKRSFGESVFSKGLATGGKEVLIKANLMNRFTKMLLPAWKKGA
jgi:hypothetical protein